MTLILAALLTVAQALCVCDMAEAGSARPPHGCCSGGPDHGERESRGHDADCGHCNGLEVRAADELFTAPTAQFPVVSSLTLDRLMPTVADLPQVQTSDHVPHLLFAHPPLRPLERSCVLLI